MLDAVPGDPDNPRGTHIRFEPGEGALWVAEAGLRGSDPDARAKLALGYWRYTARFDHRLETDAAGLPRRDVSRGAYLIAERLLWRAGADRQEAITGFARFGLASAGVNEFRGALAVGAIWQGPFAGRAEDTLGLVCAGAQRGEPFRRAALLAGEPVARHDLAWELGYRARVTHRLWLQPGVQHVLSHAPGAARSTLIFTRAELNF